MMASTSELPLGGGSTRGADGDAVVVGFSRGRMGVAVAVVVIEAVTAAGVETTVFEGAAAEHDMRSVPMNAATVVRNAGRSIRRDGTTTARCVARAVYD